VYIACTDIYPSLVVDKLVVISGIISFLFDSPVLNPLVGSGWMHLLPLLGWAFYTRFILWVQYNHFRLAFTATEWTSISISGISELANNLKELG
jgi:hypothetical protein